MPLRPLEHRLRNALVIGANEKFRRETVSRQRAVSRVIYGDKKFTRAARRNHTRDSRSSAILVVCNITGIVEHSRRPQYTPFGNRMKRLKQKPTEDPAKVWLREQTSAIQIGNEKNVSRLRRIRGKLFLQECGQLFRRQESFRGLADS